MKEASAYEKVRKNLQKKPKKWLVTGVAGFIGSHIADELLSLNQEVIGLDNFMTGSKANIAAIKKSLGKKSKGSFHFIQADIRDAKACAKAVKDVDIILHQAALGSVPRSIAQPRLVHEVNVDGFINVLLAAKEAGVERFIYASSSSCYGDSKKLPKREGEEGAPLSPYAATKTINDIYAQVFARTYGLQTIGVRYFNVFGPRQNPNSPYAAVIPLWMSALLKNKVCYINGDGKTSRDFCYVANAVQANILAGAVGADAAGTVLNVAVGKNTTLESLHSIMSKEVKKTNPECKILNPKYRDFRPGDVRHSLADISKISTLLGYKPTHTVVDGIKETVLWYSQMFQKGK
jgi:UDP-N-acetylglucosamine 4-epimerase